MSNITGAANTLSSIDTLHARKQDDPHRVHEAAQQFESLLIAQMLKSVRESQDSDGDASGDSVRGLAEEAFAGSLSKSGGLGLARLVEAGLIHHVKS